LRTTCGRLADWFRPCEGKRVHAMARMIILIGLVLVAVGLVWMLAERLGLGRLPGDIVIERENFRLYIPLMTMLIVSIVLSLVMWLINR